MNFCRQRNWVWAILIVAVGGMSMGVGGCASSTAAPVDSSSGNPVRDIAGSWSMDLSPSQDRSYIKEMVITPDAGGQGGTSEFTFTGTVYGGSAFDNGQCFRVDTGIAFSFVSDEKGESGGPYYWLGWFNPKATRPASEMLTGRVRSLSRNFQMQWSAMRTVPSDQSQPAAKSATKSR